MHIENEIKVLNIDVAEVIKKLETLEFVNKGTILYKRHVYDTVVPSANAWLRLRTDGSNTTLTYKESVSDSIDGMKEIETTVNDFTTTHLLLESAGIKSRSYQENRRILFEGMGCTVTIDYWPLIPPYLEIESTGVSQVKQCLAALGYSTDSDTTSLSTEEVYSRYNINLKSLKKLSFETTV